MKISFELIKIGSFQVFLVFEKIIYFYTNSHWLENLIPCRQSTLVAVVGTGKKVWELADLRVEHRGRLLVLVTNRPPKGRYDNGGDFQWLPPKRVKLVGEQALQMARKYKAGSSRRWGCMGPDIVELKEDEEYELEEHGRGLRVVSKSNSFGQDLVVWEVSANTLIADHVTDVAKENLGVPTGLFACTPTPTPSGVFQCMAVVLVLYTIGFSFNDYEKEDMWPYFRLWNVVWACGAFGTICGNLMWGAAAVGIENTSTKAKVYGFLINAAVAGGLTILPLGSNTLSLFIVGNISIGFNILLLIPMHLFFVAQPGFPLKLGETAPERVRILGLHFAWPRYWKWALALLLTTFGCWVVDYGIAVMYLVASSAGYGSVANLMLPTVVTALEGLFVWIVQWAYRAFVFKHRASGNPGYTLCIALCGVHVFSESVKLTSIISAAAFCEDNPDGLKWPDEGSCNPYGWVVSVCTSFVINILARCGWSRFFFQRFLCAARLDTVAILVAPSAISKLHDEVKYYIGYVRFLIPSSVLLANLLTGKGPVVFNMPATLCCIASLIAEIVEDVLAVTEIIPYAPSPQPCDFMQYDNCDPWQLYTFVSSSADTEATGISSSDGRSSARARSDSSRTSSAASVTNHKELERRKSIETFSQSCGRAFAAPPLLRTDGDYFPRALMLHGMRGMTRFELYGCIAGAMSIFSVCLYQLLLGAGYFHGVCDFPLLKRDRVKELFLWPVPLNACMYSP